MKFLSREGGFQFNNQVIGISFAAVRVLAVPTPEGYAHAPRSRCSRSFRIFRHDTFGDEHFWGDTLQLHRAMAGERHDVVGPGLTPRQALQLGLEVDVDHVPRITGQAIRRGSASLDEVQTTLELLKADAVVGVKACHDSGGSRSREDALSVQW